MRPYAIIFLAVSTAAFAPIRHQSNPSHASDIKSPILDETSSTPRILNTRTCRLKAHTVGALTTGGAPILPANKPLHSFFTENESATDTKEFSVLSWNILLPDSDDNWWNHKMYASWIPMEKREWSHRQALIRERLLLAGADIICIQEADGDTFEDDFAFMKEAGYQNCVHKKFRYRCAVFFKESEFVLEQVAHKDRALVVSLQSTKDDSRILNVVNCHLSGGAAPERRLRQVHEALDQIRKWKAKVSLTLEKQRKAKRPSPKNVLKAEMALRLHEEAGTVVCGDFNSDGNTGVRRFLVEGSIDPEWREPQYPDVPLTSKRKEHSLGHIFVDAAELAYAVNVCDGDYGEDLAFGCRPATYVVPNLASLLLLPIKGERIPRTQFGPQIARGLADTLGLNDFCEYELDRAFDSIDLDGNDLIDEGEIQQLLESVYVATYGKQIEEKKKAFFSGFRNSTADPMGLSREQLTEKFMMLQQELKGDIKRTEFGPQIARGLADTLGLHTFCENELERAFESIDLDDNDLIDEEEIKILLESVYVVTYGQQIEEERREFFSGFNRGSALGQAELSREQFAEKLTALQQELEGGREGSILVEVRTEADAQRMIDRFSPLLQAALDQVFENFSGDGGKTITEAEVSEFLIKTNGELGRGGTYQHTAAILKKKAQASKPGVLTRQDWYGVFARELGEGKWWQVVYDLEASGANLRAQAGSEGGQHYQGWLDYMYFDSQQLVCTGVQEALTTAELSRIYDDGDALPNEWYPSDHLPVAALFSW